MRMEHTGAGGIIGAPLPAMSCIHIADIEAAINHWRARAPSPDGVGLAPEIEALAEVYGRMVFARAEDVAPQQMPAMMAQKIYAVSRESLIAVRKRTMDSAPTMPSDRATLLPITAITTVVSSVSITSETANFLLYTTPACVIQ